MEPITITLAIIFGIAAAVAVVALWHKILDWAEKSLFPWLEEHFPSILPYVRDAFFFIDDKVMVHIRNAVRKAWEKLRTILLKMVTWIHRKTSWAWVRTTTSWIIKKLTPKPEVTKVTTEEEVNWDELPPDVREEFLRKGKPEYEVNVTELRDKEIQEMELST